MWASAVPANRPLFTRRTLIRVCSASSSGRLVASHTSIGIERKFGYGGCDASPTNQLSLLPRTNQARPTGGGLLMSMIRRGCRQSARGGRPAGSPFSERQRISFRPGERI